MSFYSDKMHIHLHVIMINQSQLTSATVGVYHPLFLLKSISSNTGMLANTVCPFYKINAAPWPTSSASNYFSQRSVHYMHTHRYIDSLQKLHTMPVGVLLHIPLSPASTVYMAALETLAPDP